MVMASTWSCVTYTVVAPIIEDIENIDHDINEYRTHEIPLFTYRKLTKQEIADKMVMASTWSCVTYTVVAPILLCSGISNARDSALYLP